MEQIAPAWPPLRLGNLRPDQHLLARCAATRCDNAAPCNPEPWMREGLGGLPLSAFAERLRCVCGARAARLEISAGAYHPSPSPTLYVFR
jgi:hypothetical protein